MQCSKKVFVEPKESMIQLKKGIRFQGNFDRGVFWLEKSMVFVLYGNGFGICRSEHGCQMLHYHICDEQKEGFL